MVEELLVDEEIAAASRLIELLDNNDLAVRGAMWLYESDAERWRFVVCFRERRDNTTSFYRDMARIANANPKASALSIDRVSVVPYEGSIFDRLKGALSVGGANRVRFSHNRINGVFLEDAMIYRLEA